MDVTAYAGLGSNVGDRLGFLRGAVAALTAHEAIRVARTSSVYETDPVGPAQPDFLNAVVELSTTLTSRELLDAFKRIESDLGRIVRERWGPREIDIDLLLYGDEVVEEDGLTVPHPQLAHRPFVQVPLAEIAPDLATVSDATGVRRTTFPLAP